MNSNRLDFNFSDVLDVQNMNILDVQNALNGTTFISPFLSADSSSDIMNVDFSEFAKLAELSEKSAINYVDPFKAFSVGEMKELSSNGMGTTNKRLAYIKNNNFRFKSKPTIDRNCKCGGSMHKSKTGTEFVCIGCGTIDIIVGGTII